MALDLSQATIRTGKISKDNKSLDYQFWRDQPVEKKMAAIWDMTVFHHKLKGGKEHELRLARAVGGFRKK